MDRQHFWGDEMGLIKVGPTALNAENTFTAGVKIPSTISNQNHARVLITGTYVGTLTLQSSEDDSTYNDLEDFSADLAGGKDITLGGIAGSDALFYRVGFKTGNFTSGPANITITGSA